MRSSAAIGRFFYAIALISLGAKMLIVGRFPADLMPMPGTIPGGSLLAYLVGVVLVTTGLCMATLVQIRVAALTVGAFLLLFGLGRHLPNLLSNPTNPGPWTPLFELTALSGGAFVIAGRSSPGGFNSVPTDRGQFLIRWGKWLFAGSLLVFGGLHFIYAPFIATLITSWIPGHLFWAYFVGIAFVASAVSLLLNRYVYLSGTLVGAMFLLWVIILHAPRVLAKPAAEPEWTSLLIALAMSGIGFTLASFSTKRT